MSAQQQLMAPEQAYDVLVAQVHAPTFFEKLARVYKIAPNSPEHARDLLDMAAWLRSAHADETSKEASAQGDLIREARHDLEHELVRRGYPNLTNDSAVKQASHEMAGNGLLCEAALVWQNHLANSQQ